MPFKFLKFRSIQRTLVLLSFVFMLFLRLLSYLRESEMAGVSRTQQSFQQLPQSFRRGHGKKYPHSRGTGLLAQTRFLGETQVSKCREAVLNRCHCPQLSRPRTRPQAAGLASLFPVRLLQVAAHCQASLGTPRPATGKEALRAFSVQSGQTLCTTSLLTKGAGCGSPNCLSPESV